MKIVILEDNYKCSRAQEIGWGYYLTRTRVSSIGVTHSDCYKECAICGHPIGAEPGWKTIFHGTAYHEGCLTIVDECTQKEVSKNCQKFFTAAMRVGGWQNWR